MDITTRMDIKTKTPKAVLEIFPLAASRATKRNRAKILNKMGNTRGILRLIVKCEKLVAELNNDGENGEIIEEILINLAKLKKILLLLFQRKQRQILEMHWEQIRKNSAEIGVKQKHSKHLNK